MNTKQSRLKLATLLFLLYATTCAQAFTESNVIKNYKQITTPVTHHRNNAVFYVISIYKKFYFGLDAPPSSGMQLFLKNDKGQIIFIGTLSEGTFKCFSIKPGHYELIATKRNVGKHTSMLMSTHSLLLGVGKTYFVAEKSVTDMSNAQLTTLNLAPEEAMNYIINIRSKYNIDPICQNISFNYPFKVSYQENATYVNPAHATSIYDFSYIICKINTNENSNTTHKCIYPFLGFSYSIFGVTNDAPLVPKSDMDCPRFMPTVGYFPECSFGNMKMLFND